MIKKLQHRFILLTMSCIGFIFLLILLILNISMTAASQKRDFDLLSEYIRNKNALTRHAKEPYAVDSPAPDGIPPAFIAGGEHGVLALFPLGAFQPPDLSVRQQQVFSLHVQDEEELSLIPAGN